MVSSDPWARDGGHEADATRRGLADIARELDRLEQRLPQAPRREVRSNDIGALAGKVGALAEKLKFTETQIRPRVAPSNDARLGLLADTIREIEERTAALAAPQRRPEPSRLAGVDRALEDLRSRLEAMRPARPAALSASASPDSDRDRAERQLRAAIAEIAARQEAIDRAPEVTAPPASHRAAAPAPNWTEPVIPSVDITGEIARLTEALSAMTRNGQKDSEVLHRLDHTLNNELARISDALDGAAREATLASVEAGYTHLIERLDRISRERAEANAPLLALPSDVQRLAARMEDLARSLPERERLNDLAVGVAQLGRAVASREGSSEIAAMERRLEEIAGAVDGLYRVNRAPEMPPALVEILTRFESLAERLENNPQQRALDALRDEVSALRDDVAGTGRPEAEGLENQVRALVMRLDTMPQDNDGGIAQLEAQISRLADRLDALVNKPNSYGALEANLGRLETLIRGETLGAARDAARSAVAEFAGASQHVDNQAVRSLKDDLRRLQAVAESTDSRTQETLDTVQGALEKVVSRLAAIETASPPVYAEPAPAAAPADTARYSAGATAASRVAAAVATDRGGDRKADFIAAARRAAQAAAAESDALRAQPEAENAKPGPLSRIGQVLRTRRRPVMLAAAAVVLTIAVIQLFGWTQDESSRVAGTPSAATVATAHVTPPRTREDRAGSRGVLAAVTPSTAAVETSKVESVRSDGEVGRTDPVAFAPPSTVGTRFASNGGGAQSGAFVASDATPATKATSAPAPAANTAVAAPMPDAAVGAMSLRVAAAAGDPYALYEVASRYAEGREVQKNTALAVEWYRRAAERGLPIAEFRLAAMYERGEGIAKDRKAARAWYAKAAEQGNVRAMHNLAVMISEGVEAGPDYGEASDWFIKAADHGVKDSQYNLGVIYARGLGRKQDLVQSYKWFALAATQGDADATSRRDEVAKTLTPDQLAQARAATQAWRSAPVQETANVDPVPDPSWSTPVEKRTALDRQGLVKKVQALLTERGYDPGPADGNAGAKTRAAVRAFQSSAGVAANGEIDTNLVTVLSNKAG